MSSRMEAQVALVTGASSGIGKSLVQQLAAKGYKVVGCARNIQAIEDLQCPGKENIRAVACDITKEEQVLSMFDIINKEYGGLDICVNNAGMAKFGSVLNGSTDNWRAMMEVNVIGLCIVSREAVKSMQKKGADNCRIMNVNSILGVPQFRFKMARATLYIATKHAVTGVTTSLRGELIEAGLAKKIQVMQIFPGLVETEFSERAAGTKEASAVYRQYKALQPEDVAESIIHALASPPHVTITDITMLPTEAELLQQ